MPAGSNVVVTALLEEMDAAYATGHWHALVPNLTSVSAEAWDWVPPGGERTVRQLVRHLALCKLLYENTGFGDAQAKWDDLKAGAPAPEASPEEELAWLDQCHTRLRGAIATVVDDDLIRERLDHNGNLAPTRWFITTMTHHDLYHCGEINHIRSLRTGDDSWGQEGDR